MQNFSFVLDSGETIWLQSSADLQESAFEKASGETVFEKTTKKFSEALAPLRSTSESLIKTFQGLAKSPDEIEIEFSVTLNVEAGIVISSASVEGNFKVKLKWAKS